MTHPSVHRQLEGTISAAIRELDKINVMMKPQEVYATAFNALIILRGHGGARAEYDNSDSFPISGVSGEDVLHVLKERDYQLKEGVSPIEAAETIVTDIYMEDWQSSVMDALRNNDFIEDLPLEEDEEEEFPTAAGDYGLVDGEKQGAEWYAWLDNHPEKPVEEDKS